MKNIGWTLVVLNLLMAVGSGVFFLFVEKLDIVSWLAVNTCAVAILIFCVGFILHRGVILGFSIPFLLFYGTGGLMVFEWGWTAALLIPQISHIIMTTTVIYIIIYLVVKRRWKAPLIGAIVGVALLSVLFPLQQNYQRQNPEILRHLHFKEGYSPLD